MLVHVDVFAPVGIYFCFYDSFLIHIFLACVLLVVWQMLVFYLDADYLCVEILCMWKQ